MRDVRRNGPNFTNLGWLRKSWGNEGWSADIPYLMKVCELASSASGTVLECGSGLTSLLLGLMSDKTVISLEHVPEWAVRVNSALDAAGCSNRVSLVKMVSYEDFDWYEMPPIPPKSVAFVVCDGPPSATRGGRFGLFPLAREHFAPGARILMDDAERSTEKEIISRWNQQFGLQVEFSANSEGEWALLTVTS